MRRTQQAVQNVVCVTLPLTFVNAAGRGGFYRERLNSLVLRPDFVLQAVVQNVVRSTLSLTFVTAAGQGVIYC